MMNFRFPAREVKVGNVGIGGNNPVRAQSMTNTSTLDMNATAAQVIQLAEAGCEIVRLAVPGVREARQLELIKNQLTGKGCHIPLIADVHFNPEAALIAASIVEKVRINPGNYTDRNIGKANFSEEDFLEANKRIKDRIQPLIEVCKKRGTALRIGSNHGSLSERIVSRYGNTPEGMVEAALEFVRICRVLDFHQIVLSMKASSVRTMVYANRLLVKRMIAESMDYPIHLGVTEAGNSSEGRLKSAIGIGTLLADGIGDTIRVSLTEDPVNEIPVAKKIIEYFDQIPVFAPEQGINHFLTLPYTYQPEVSNRTLLNVDEKMPLVISKPIQPGIQKPDLVVDGDHFDESFMAVTGIENLTDDVFQKNKVIIFEATQKAGIFEFREFFKRKLKTGSSLPVILKKRYENPDLIVDSAIDFGPLFLDGHGDGLWIEGGDQVDGDQLVGLSFQLLQACGARITQTEFIACPSCGRTQYDIQASLEAIKSRTAHLKGLKIAVMGCIVNGPGEMADADYGYVGMGAGKVALFKGKKLLKKAVPEEEAVEQLIILIKENGDWKDVPVVPTSV